MASTHSLDAILLTTQVAIIEVNGIYLACS